MSSTHFTDEYCVGFSAYFQFGFPIYSAKEVRFRFGHLRPTYEFEDDVKDEPSPALRFISENVVWTYTSPSFPMVKVSCILLPAYLYVSLFSFNCINRPCGLAKSSSLHF